jgi:hypothetical protein
MATTVLKPTSFYAFMHDPKVSARGFAYHVNYVAVTTHDDGAVTTSDERQCNMAKALELGLDLGPMAAVLNTSAQAGKELALAELATKDGKIEEANAKVAEANSTLAASLRGASEAATVQAANVTRLELQVAKMQTLQLETRSTAGVADLQRQLNDLQTALSAYENDPATFWSRVKYLFTGK